MKAWVTLGYFDERGDGQILELNAGDSSVREVLRFDPPEDLLVQRKGFTGAAWSEGTGRGDLLVCGHAAIFRFDGLSLQHNGTLHQPCFNDLHGVTVAAGRIYVANTGLDTIEGFDLDGRYLGSMSFEAPWLAARRMEGAVPSSEAWESLRNPGWNRRSFGFDHDSPVDPYFREPAGLPFHQRKQRDLVHPNHVCVIDDRVLVTSLARRGVIDMATWRQPIQLDSPSHDGVVVNEGFYLTRVDGYVERRSLSDLSGTGRSVDVASASGISGWCRGLHMGGGLLWVGFTEMRRAPAYPWCRGSIETTNTAVVVMDQITEEVVEVFHLGDPGRHAKVFSIFHDAT